MSAIHQQENSLHSFAKLTGLPSQLGQPGKVGCRCECMGLSVQGAVDMGSVEMGAVRSGAGRESQGGISSRLSIFALV